MKRIFLYLFITISVSSSFAAPFKNLKTSVLLPDGNMLTLYVTGDEYARRVHDKEGYTVLLGDDGYAYYAIKNKEGQLIPSKYKVGIVNPLDVNLTVGLSISEKEYKQKRTFYESNYYFTDLKKLSNNSVMNAKSFNASYKKNETIFNNIVITISFPDAITMNKDRLFYENIFMGQDKKSLRQYYQEVSYGQLNMKSEFFPVTHNLTYIADNVRNYYRPFNQTSNPLGYQNQEQSTNREHNLLANAINSLKTQIESTFSAEELDIDNDGLVDNITFIIQGNSDGWSDLLWAHRWSLYTQEVFIHNKRVMTFVFQPENQVNITTLCHEMFHALGAPDLYHYDQTPTIQALAPVGKWDLMESGSGHMSAYMKYAYGGWINEIPLITEPGVYTLNPLSSDDNQNICYKINSVNPNEYFVLEYRKSGGLFETDIYGSGLVAYRINKAIYPQGNRNGPPDEVYAYRPYGGLLENGTITQSFFSSDSRRTAIGGTLLLIPFLSDGTDGLLRIKNISSAQDQISFEVVSLPMASSVNSLSGANQLSVEFLESNLIISGLEMNESLSVWSLLGQCVASYSPIRTETINVALPRQGGVYILEYKQSAIKLIVK